MSAPFDQERDAPTERIPLPPLPTERVELDAPRRRRDAGELVAITLAVCLAVAIVALALAAGWAQASNGDSLSSTSTTLLATVLGAIAGSVATYLGGRP